MTDEENRLSDHEEEKAKTPERSGEFLFRVLKPFGCILVLVIMILYFVICFTYKGGPTDAPAENGTAAAETQAP